MIAAIFVQETGPYSTINDVVAWHERMDARRYAGPYPVVAHPPCQRWGAFWSGGTSPGSPRKLMGDDAGCFAHALWSVRSFGGVLEHPAHSRAWGWFGLPSPGLGGWWGARDSFGGATCQVDQGSYGHIAPKATWLYACVPMFPELIWGPSGAEGRVENMSTRQREVTPPDFRDLLIGIAKSACIPEQVNARVMKASS